MEVKSIVKYRIATYHGEITINHDENDTNEQIIARAKKILTNKVGCFPLGSESWKVERQ